MTLPEDDLHRLAESLKQTSNHLGIDDFEGYSPNEMSEILYRPLEDSCPVRLKKVDEDVYRQIPMLNLVRFIISRIRESGKLKLTITGKLPVKLVAVTYAQGFMKDELLEFGSYKLYKEEDSMSIHLAHILMQLAGIVRKSKGNLYVTQKGEKLSADPNKLLKALLLAFGQQFNWSYFDGYGDQPIGKIGWLYSLLLLNKYGAISRPSNFYAEKYFLAFPPLTDVVENGRAANCYIIRSFDRFIFLFGLVTIEKDHWIKSAQVVMATPLFYSLISVTPPGSAQKKEMN
jgi:hypothetical protein